MDLMEWWESTIWSKSEEGKMAYTRLMIGPWDDAWYDWFKKEFKKSDLYWTKDFGVVLNTWNAPNISEGDELRPPYKLMGKKEEKDWWDKVYGDSERPPHAPQ